MLSGPDVVFAAEPVLHAGLQAIERNAIACLEQAIRDGKGVVEDGVVGEVAHCEAVDPPNGTEMWAACGVDAFDAKPASEHAQTKRVNRGESTGTVWVGPVSLPVP